MCGGTLKGRCMQGTCICNRAWTGPTCESMFLLTFQCSLSEALTLIIQLLRIHKVHCSLYRTHMLASLLILPFPLTLTIPHYTHTKYTHHPISGVCPSNNGGVCSGHGVCENGVCNCFRSYEGEDCASSNYYRIKPSMTQRHIFFLRSTEVVPLATGVLMVDYVTKGKYIYYSVSLPHGTVSFTVQLNQTTPVCIILLYLMI